MAVVLFMFSSTLNANSFLEINEAGDPATCFEYADRWARITGFWQSLSHEQEYRVFVSLYDDCMNQ